MNIWLKWARLVLANALLGIAVMSVVFLSDFYIDFSMLLGFLTAVVVFVGFYAGLEKYLVSNNQAVLQRSLTQAAVIRALLQFTLVMDLYAGVLAIDIMEKTGLSVGFLYYFSLTMITGTILSLVVAFLMAFLSVAKRWQKEGDDKHKISTTV